VGVAFAFNDNDDPQQLGDPAGTSDAPTASTTGAPSPGATTRTTVQPGSGGTVGSAPTNPAPTTPPPSYPPITGLSISTSANETIVNFTVTVNPNGKTAQVHVQTNLQNQTFNTGTGVWSWSSSDNVGYNVTDFINVTVTDPDRPSVSDSKSQKTPCAFRNNNGQWPTFNGWSIGSFSQGTEQTANLPGGIAGNLSSITGNGTGAFHVVTYHQQNQQGNLAHWDSNVGSGQLPDVPGYKQTASVKVYFNREC
jgi:hypothetical protein